MSLKGDGVEMVKWVGVGEATLLSLVGAGSREITVR